MAIKMFILLGWPAVLIDVDGSVDGDANVRGSLLKKKKEMYFGATRLWRR